LGIKLRFHAMTLTFDFMILNVCSTSHVTWSNFIPNWSEIQQSAAKLLTIIYFARFSKGGGAIL